MRRYHSQIRSAHRWFCLQEKLFYAWKAREQCFLSTPSRLREAKFYSSPSVLPACLPCHRPSLILPDPVKEEICQQSRWAGRPPLQQTHAYLLLPILLFLSADYLVRGDDFGRSNKMPFDSSGPSWSWRSNPRDSPPEPISFLHAVFVIR
jgi:hypothetical protein